ncbi:MAG TPA: hypothetical protein VIU15_37265 [Streptomyces sp.]
MTSGAAHVTEFSAEFAELVERYLRSTGGSQKSAARAAGVAHQTLSGWKLGKHLPVDFDEAWRVVVTLLSRVHARVPRPSTTRQHPGVPGPGTEAKEWWDAQRSYWEELYRAARGESVLPDAVTTTAGRRYVFAEMDDDPGPRPTAGTPPSQLLTARHEVIPFDARRTELDMLTAWRDHKPSLWSARLCLGPGGQGKTRLAIGFARESRAVGWRTVALRPGGPLERHNASAERSKRIRSGAGHLVVVDYADRVPADDLLEVLGAIPSHLRIRLLLLARTADGWWARVQEDLKGAGIPYGDLPLGPLFPDAEARRAHFRLTAGRFAEVLGTTADAAAGPPPPSRSPGDDSVLSLHMAALASVLPGRGGEHGGDEVRPQDDLAGFLLGRERGYWRSLAVAAGPEAGGRVGMADLERAVFMATLVGPLPYRKALEALKDALGVSAEHARRVLDLHAACCPPASGGALHPLLPDRLGEDFLALLLPDHAPDAPRPAYTPDRLTPQWAEDLLKPILTGPATERAREAVTRLVAAASHRPHVTPHLSRLFSDSPGLAVTVGGAPLSAYARLEDADLRALVTISTQLPWNEPEFTGAAIDVLDRVLHEIPSPAEDPSIPLADHAAILHEWAQRLLEGGRHAEAAEAAEKLIALCVPGGEDTGDLTRVTGLLVLAKARSAVGRTAEALVAAHDALDFLAGHPEPEPALVHCAVLTQVAVLEGEAGDLLRAEEYASEAVGLLDTHPEQTHGLAADTAGALADALAVRGWICGEQGDGEAAAMYIARAAGLYAASSERGPRLGATLSNLINRVVLLASAGQVAEGLRVADTALDLCRAPAEGADDPLADLAARVYALRAALRWQSAMALDGSSPTRTALLEAAESDAAHAESLLADTDGSPRRVRDRVQLIWAVVNRALALSTLERHEEALRLTERACRVFRRRPNPGRPDPGGFDTNVRPHGQAPAAGPGESGSDAADAHLLATFAGVRWEARADLVRAADAAQEALEIYAALPTPRSPQLEEEIADCERTLNGIRELTGTGAEAGDRTRS